ncbi:MAG: hypothetical protein JJU05_18950 [Verrucomicrobia bacterium]|nr:hypothetical protein [Verrucomicrobiota bacterium]MCH8527195.1 hypothetical protein [Kiritimatiellia bacterium]
MNPKLTDPKWTAYVLGELTEAERARAEQELAADADLREHVEALRLTVGLTREALSQPVPGAEDLVRECETALAPPPARFPIRYLFPTALAACLALFLGLRALLPSGTPPALLDETGNEIDTFAADGMIIPEGSFELHEDALSEETLSLEFGRNLREAPAAHPRAFSFREEVPPQPAATPAPPSAPARALERQRAVPREQTVPLMEPSAEAGRRETHLDALNALAADLLDEPEEDEDEDEEEDDEEEKKDEE